MPNINVGISLPGVLLLFVNSFFFSLKHNFKHDVQASVSLPETKLPGHVITGLYTVAYFQSSSV